MWIQPLGWDDPLEEEMTTHSQYSCLKNSMDRGDWQAIARGVTKESDTTEHLSTHGTYTLYRKPRDPWVSLIYPARKSPSHCPIPFLSPALLGPSPCSHHHQMLDELSEIGILMVTGQDLGLHSLPCHLQHHLGLLHLQQMHTAKAPETPEQYLGLGSGRLGGLDLTEDTQMGGRREDTSSLPQHRTP